MLGFCSPFWLRGQQLGIGVEGLFIDRESQKSAGSVAADACLFPGDGAGWDSSGCTSGKGRVDVCLRGCDSMQVLADGLFDSLFGDPRHLAPKFAFKIHQ